MLVVERDTPPGKWVGKEEALVMPTYVALMNRTDQGARSAKDTVQRRDQADALAQKHGASASSKSIGPWGLTTSSRYSKP
jgi:hypothetical protein